MPEAGRATREYRNRAARLGGGNQERLVIVSKYRGNPWVVLIVMSLGFFMTLLDLTIVNIAIPNMITKLHASLDGILWVINAYALVLAVLLITAGRLGDLRGQRKMFIAGVVTFTLASAACGLSPTVGWLVAFRARAGSRGGAADAADAGDPDHGVPAGAARSGVRHLGRGGRRGDDRRPDPWRPAGQRVRLAVHLLSSTCRSAPS